MPLITLFRNVQDTRPEPLPVSSFVELAEALADYDFRDHKEGPLFSPTEFREGGRRCNADALRVHFGVLDFDDLSPSEIELTRRALDPFEHVWHSTYSHTPTKGRYRAVLPLSRPVEAAEWGDFWPRMADRFGSKRDESCKELARFYYLPAAPVGSEPEYLYQPGIVLDVAEVLAAPNPTWAKPPRQALEPARDLSRYKPSPWAVNWALGKLEEKLAAIREIDDAKGPMHGDLNAASWFLGTLCPHLLDPLNVAEQLLKAALHLNPDREAKYVPIILEGIEEGQAKPFTPEPRYAWTDTGNAERVVDLFRGRIHYIHTWETWLIWDGATWSFAPDIQPQVKEACAELHAEVEQIQNPKTKKAGRAWALVSESASKRRAAAFLAESEDGVRVDHNALNADPMLLGTENGVLDLRTGEVRAALATDFITKSAKIDYRADAECPTWERFLSDIMVGDESMVAYLQRAIGYCLTGDTREQKLFFLHGDGSNGKSTFINVLLELLGDYGAPGAPELLLAKGAGAHPTEQADLHTLRLVSCQEVEEGRYWNEALLKLLTGGDPIKARRMNEDFWSFTPTHKFWVSGNHKPNVRGTDNGIWRRLILIPFKASFLDRADTDLPRRLRAELPGILAWAVRGCLEWQRIGLQEPASILIAVAKYRAEQDTIGAFLRERCETGPHMTAGRQQLRAAYERWCDEEGDRRPFSPRAFNEALRSRGFEEGRTNSDGRLWKGLRLVQSSGHLRAVGA